MLNKSVIALFCAVALSATPSLVVHAQPPQQPSVQPPAYAKWGTMAVQEAQKRYPTAKVVDYKHVGRTKVSATVTQETFKLWLKAPNREFGVFVRITFDTTTEQVKAIDFQETTR